MKKILSVIVMALCLGSSKTVCAATSNVPNITVRYFIVTAPTSPSNSLCLQNVMNFLDKGNVTGLIPTDYNSNPVALYQPHILRVSDFIYTPVNYPLHDATNGPTGPFAFQNGGRIGWSCDWKNRTPFLASDIYFGCDSDEPAHSLYYVGNIATNTFNGLPLAFSSTLRGELWDADGKPIAWYYNGESVANHPVNRVICLIREGYYAADTNQVVLDLNYFKGHHPMKACVQFYMNNGQSGGLCMDSRPWFGLTGVTNKIGVYTLECQRQLGLTYTIQGVPENMNPPQLWNNLYSGVGDSFSFVGPYYPNGFFRAFEGTVIIPP